MPLSLAGAGLLAALLVLLLFHRWLFQLAGLALRTLLGGLFLQLLALLGNPLGISLGVNLFNALVLGLLGAPGFGLLLLLSWTL